MTKEELCGLIDLHDAYQKHTPTVACDSFGTFSSSVSICRGCMCPVSVTEAETKTLYSSVIPGLLYIYQSHPTIFKLFINFAKQKDMTTAYCDLILQDSAINMPQGIMWSMIRQLGMPSKVTPKMLGKFFDGALQCAIAMPALRPAAYKAALQSQSIEEISKFAIRVLNKPDEALMARAKKMFEQRGEDDLFKHGYDDMVKWYDRKIKWGK